MSLFADGVVQTTVELSDDSTPRTALLVEFNSQLAELAKWTPDDQARLRTIAARVRFAWAGLPRMIGARLIESGRRSGDEIRMHMCSPARIGGSVRSAPARAPVVASALFSNTLLAARHRAEVDRALHWYLAGIDAPDPFVETVCLWAAIEALSPDKRSPAQCKCGAGVPPCVFCGEQRLEHHVLASVREGLRQVSTLSDKQIGAFYEFRSKLLHGQHEPTYATYADAAAHVEEIRPLLQRMLWMELRSDCARSIEYIQQPEHMDIDIDLVYRCKWFDGIYETPWPLFSDMQLGVGSLPDATEGDLIISSAI